jgi:hypothetical protein
VLEYGLIAEEVAAVYPELVVRGANGQVESVRYHELIPMLLNELQAQSRTIDAVSAANDSLRAELHSLEARHREQDLEAAAARERIERIEAVVGSARPAMALLR